MMAVAMALVVAAGQSGAGFVSGMGSVMKVCAETEDTTEQEYITADGCYTLWTGVFVIFYESKSCYLFNDAS